MEPANPTATLQEAGAKGSLAGAAILQGSSEELETPIEEAVVAEMKEQIEPIAAAAWFSPQGSGLVGTPAVVDWAALGHRAQWVFDQIDHLGSQLAEAQEQTGLPACLLALCAAGAALEVTRRQIKSSAAEVDAAFAGQGLALAWSFGAADPLADDE
jgi:hypothetical protein